MLKKLLRFMIMIGNKTIEAIYLGSKTVSEIWKGNTKVYPEDIVITYKIESVAVNYSTGSYVKVDTSNYATLTATIQEYVNGTKSGDTFTATLTDLSVDNHFVQSVGQISFNIASYGRQAVSQNDYSVTYSYLGTGATESVVGTTTIALQANSKHIKGYDNFTFYLNEVAGNLDVSSAQTFDIPMRAVTEIIYEWTSGLEDYSKGYLTSSTSYNIYLTLPELEDWAELVQTGTDYPTLDIYENTSSASSRSCTITCELNGTSSAITYTITQAEAEPYVPTEYFNVYYYTAGTTDLSWFYYDAELTEPIPSTDTVASGNTITIYYNSDLHPNVTAMALWYNNPGGPDVTYGDGVIEIGYTDSSGFGTGIIDDVDITFTDED